MVSYASWHPVVAAQALRAGHGVLAARLLGQPLALWRSADGQPQAWEDRCPHRGVRLSLGRVIGNHLACAYHGWEYAAGSGRCVAIPAMPRDPVPGKVCAMAYRVHETQCMVWVALEPQGDPGNSNADHAPLDLLDSDAWSPRRLIRSLAVHASLDRVQAALTLKGFALRGQSRWVGTLAETPLCIFTQQADPALVMLHCWMVRSNADFAAPALFAQLRQLRSTIEQGAS
ncbi:MAG: Rieske (2Fe-2S) protein [Burkholderiaceae bacterium]